jgi:hypothetical protein
MTEHLVFLDESGDDNLQNIDPNYPIFVLGAVIFEKTYHNTVAVREFAEFKARHMTPGQILHTVDMLRNQRGFEFLKDPARRERFYRDLNALIARVDFTLIAAILDMPKAIAKWGLQQRTPYIYLMQLLLERIYLCLRGKGTAQVFAESRQPHLDALIRGEFLRVRGGASMIHPATLLERMFPEEIGFLPKSANPGAELADVLVSPVGRRYLGRSSPISAQVIEAKTYKRPYGGRVNGWGRIVQP